MRTQFHLAWEVSVLTCGRSLVRKVDWLTSEQKPGMIAEEGWNRASQRNHHLWESLHLSVGSNICNEIVVWEFCDISAHLEEARIKCNQ